MNRNDSTIKWNESLTEHHEWILKHYVEWKKADTYKVL